MTRIGVLALQGDFREHIRAMQALGAEAHAVRLPSDLRDVDGLIIPGGESTVMGKLMIEYRLDQPLRELIASGMPTWGTCAGLILLSRETDNGLAGQPLLAAMNIRTRRNAFGPQRASFETDLYISALGEVPYHAVFIRGPAVEEVGAGVEVLARLDDADMLKSGKNGNSASSLVRASSDSPAPVAARHVSPSGDEATGTIVAVRQGPLLGSAFHPEVTGDLRFHDYFLGIVRGAGVLAR